MNIAIVLSGGKGTRFGGNLPKQYMDLCGKKVIDYVLESAISSSKIDEIVLVIDEDYISLIDLYGDPHIHVVPNGKERVYSVKNALDYIKENFSDCENIIILQAVSPFITPNLIDNYISLLDEYDVVTTADKCTGEIFNINKYEKINRNNYYFCQSPEAFKFKDLYNNIDFNSEYTELIYHYKKQPNIYYYLDFSNNIKLTYRADLEYAKFLMENGNDSNLI